MLQNYTFISMSARDVPSFEIQNMGQVLLYTEHQLIALSLGVPDFTNA